MHTQSVRRKIDGQSNFLAYQLSWIIWGERGNKGKEQENPENIHLLPEDDVKCQKYMLKKNEQLKNKSPCGPFYFKVHIYIVTCWKHDNLYQATMITPDV